MANARHAGRTANDTFVPKGWMRTRHPQALLPLTTNASRGAAAAAHVAAVVGGGGEVGGAGNVAFAGGLVPEGATGGWEVVVDGGWEPQPVTVTALPREDEVGHMLLAAARGRATTSEPQHVAPIAPTWVP
jgi:hypothetical protein